MIPIYCIAHKDPKLAAHLYDAIINTPKRRDYSALVSVVAHPLIANIAPTHGLVGICGWRKIVVRGVPDKAHRVVTTAECTRITRESVEPHPGFDFLLCEHNFFKVGGRTKTIKEQWDKCHHSQDLTDCLDLAEEMRVMTSGDRLALEAEPALIEGGFSMGVYPGQLVRDSLAKVIPLYMEFARRYRWRFMRYDPVQRRCVAFLCERVETHFILKELRARYPHRLPPELFGCLTSSWDGKWEAGTMK